MDETGRRAAGIMCGCWEIGDKSRDIHRFCTFYAPKSVPERDALGMDFRLQRSDNSVVGVREREGGKAWFWGWRLGFGTPTDRWRTGSGDAFLMIAV